TSSTLGAGCKKDELHGFRELSKEVMRKAYIPFWKLGTYNCFIYTLIVAFSNLFVFALTEKVEAQGEYPWGMVVFIYLLLCMKAFRIPLMSLIEQKARCFEKLLVKIETIETDGLLGDYKNSNQEIKNCYPKDVQAERDKLICIDENGKN
ncbi:MAG: hypothetical protein ACI4DV_02255, partial [Lachnospiraceae bacterium]